MGFSPAFTSVSVYSLGGWPRGGLRLNLLRKFKAFLAFGTCQASASSYGVGSAVPVHSAPHSIAGANSAVKPTANPLRGLAAAYLAR